jgi:hypothetical protein
MYSELSRQRSFETNLCITGRPGLAQGTSDSFALFDENSL